MSQDTNLSVLARLGWSFLLHVMLPGVHGELHAGLGGHPVVPHGRRPGAVLTSSEFDNSSFSGLHCGHGLRGGHPQRRADGRQAVLGCCVSLLA